MHIKREYHSIITNVMIMFVFLLISIMEPSAVLAATEYDIYAKAEHFTWKEFNNGAELLEESGPMFGIGFSAKRDIYQSLTLKIRSELFGGSVDYDGQTQAGSSVDSDTEYIGYKIEIDGGWKFIIKEKSSLEPFIGLGARLWKRDIEDSNNARGIEENWTTTYARIGFRGDHVYPHELKVFAEAAVKLPIDNENEVDFRSFGLGEVEVDPGNRVSFFVEAGLKWKKFKSSIFYEGMRFSESDTVGPFLIFQPESEADIFGISAGISF